MFAPISNWKLVVRSLVFHARSNLGLMLGAAVGSAVLAGALLVGESVRASLGELALTRLGKVELAISSGDRFFRSQLATDVQYGIAQSGFIQPATMPVAPALLLPAVAVADGGAARANHVRVLGIDERFWQLAKEPPAIAALEPDSVILNSTLAEQLQAKAGDDILFRVQKPAALSRDAPLAPADQSSFALRLKVHAVIAPSQLGSFNLQASQLAPFNAFVALNMLAGAAGVSNRANLLLVGPVPSPARFAPSSAPQSPARLTGPPGRAIDMLTVAPRVLRQKWQLEDAGLEWREILEWRSLELRSQRVFLDPEVAEAVFNPRTNTVLPASPGPRGSPVSIASPAQTSRLAGSTSPALSRAVSPAPAARQPSSFSYYKPSGVLTYLVNEMRVGERSTPYSMVTAIGQPVTPPDLGDDEIIINQWLAEDLGAKPGDELSMAYYVVGPMRGLEERSARFKVRSILPMDAPGVDPGLMPDFPGLTDAENCRDWDTGLPIEVGRIRDRDEQYWRKYRGTPKALVTLATGRKLWQNRFGNLTAIRFHTLAGGLPPRTLATLSQNRLQQFRAMASYQANLSRALLNLLDPAAFGLSFQPVRARAHEASAQSQDFGQLFLGFSFFLIAAALLLMSVLFQFGLDQRAGEVGALLALGFRPRHVRRLLLAEGATLAVIGAGAGVWGGAWYAQAMLKGLSTIWSRAVGGVPLQFHSAPHTLAIGFGAGVAVVCLTLWAALRVHTRQSATALLAGASEEQSWTATDAGRRRRNSLRVVAVASGLAVLLLGAGLAAGDLAAGLFFGAGALLLIAGMATGSAWLAGMTSSREAARFTVVGMGVRGAARRRKRSLAVLGLLACGGYLVLSIGVFRLEAVRDAAKRSSGTGGFAFVGESTQPIVHDLNTVRGLEACGLDTNLLSAARIVQFRVREGDEASCLNLNRAKEPRLLGVQPEQLQQRGAFRFSKVAKGFAKDQPWLLLKRQPGDDAIPAIGDEASIKWAMGQKVGSIIPYTDERGQVFKLRLVAAVANSILQGNLVIDEAEFTARFPSVSGYRMFLVDVSPDKAARVSSALTEGLKDLGLELTPAVRRLAAFNAVQNTYLGTFQALGGLGLLLGSAGMGAVVLRNVFERRGELALLLAVGFRRRTLRRLVLAEHAALLAAGLAVGVGAAMIAVLPALVTSSTELPHVSLSLTLCAVIANGLLWTWAATLAALRSDLMDTLRRE